MNVGSTPPNLSLPAPRQTLALRGRVGIDPETNARKKWGNEVFESGYQMFPDVLLRCQRFLGLEAIDVLILMNITMHWWSYDDLPYPRPSAIARRMGVTTRTVERRIAGSLGPDGKPCEFDTKGLLQRAHIVANWPPIYIGKESDRHWEEGEDLSLLKFRAVEYRRKGNAVADDEQLARIAKSPKREFMRRGINQHTLEKITKREPVRAIKLAECLKVLEESTLNQKIVERSAISNHHAAQ